MSKKSLAAVFISPGHIGKSRNYTDRGAHVTTTDEESGMLVEIWEAHEALDFMVSLIRFLEQDSRIVTFPLSYGDYAERNRWANLQEEKMRLNLTGRSIFVAPHLNAGGGSYSLVLYDKRSIRGKRLAEKIVSKWKEYTEVIQTDVAGDDDEAIDVKKIFSDYKIKGIGRGDRGFSIIAGTRMPAVILEPIFMDNKEHMSYWLDGGIDDFAEATADAITEYLFNDNDKDGR